MAPSGIQFRMSLILILFFNGSENVNAVRHGDPTRPGEFKYIVAVNTLYFKCGGAIISENHILTAAHCASGVKETEIWIVAGSTNVETTNAVVRNVKAIHVHPSYSSSFGGLYWWAAQFVLKLTGMESHNDCDVAVLTLDTPLEWTENIVQVDLPEDNTPLPYCISEKLGGWGDIDDSGSLNSLLYSVWYNILPLAECELRGAMHTTRQFCAVNPDGHSCIMAGDSGSPWVHNNIVFGVVSLGSCNPEHPVIFSKVSSFVGFIRQAMKN